jgi:hypothetical protein
MINRVKPSNSSPIMPAANIGANSDGILYVPVALSMR